LVAFKRSYFEFFFRLFFLDTSSIPEVDLAFAISTTAASADATFRRMREMVKAVIDMYGTDKIRYGIIVFGATTSTSLSFSETYPTTEAFKNHLDLMRRVKGEPDLKKALEDAKQLFERAPSRPNAKKVLVVIIDKKSGNKPEEIKTASKPLHDDNIKVSFQ
jgi:hypothetical protein